MVKPSGRVRVEPYVDLDATGEGLEWAGLDSSGHFMTREDVAKIVAELQEYLDATA